MKSKIKELPPVTPPPAGADDDFEIVLTPIGRTPAMERLLELHRRNLAEIVRLYGIPETTKGRIERWQNNRPSPE